MMMTMMIACDDVVDDVMLNMSQVHRHHLNTVRIAPQHLPTVRSQSYDVTMGHCSVDIVPVVALYP